MSALHLIDCKLSLQKNSSSSDISSQDTHFLRKKRQFESVKIYEQADIDSFVSISDSFEDYGADFVSTYLNATHRNTCNNWFHL